MREINFRAWHKELKKMLTWDELVEYCNDQFHIVKTVNFFEDNELEIMQYTGLKDKNEKEIYESDIVEYDNYYYEYDTGFAEWVILKGEVYKHDDFYTIGDKFQTLPLSMFPNANDDDVYEFEDDYEKGLKVIGNIYETSKLISKDHATESA